MRACVSLLVCKYVCGHAYVCMCFCVCDCVKEYVYCRLCAFAKMHRFCVKYA